MRCFVVVVLVISSTLAAPQAAAQGAAESLVYDPLRAPTDEQNRDRRLNDTLALSAGAFVYNLLGVGIGGEAAVYVGADTLLFVDATMAESRFPRATSTTAGLGLTRFFGDVFYARVSGRLRAFTLGIKTSQELRDDEEREVPPADAIETRDSGVDVAVGFRRQWGRFMLNADILGAYFPLVVTAKAAYSDGPEGRVRIPYEEREAVPEFRVAYLRAGVSF